MSENTQAEAVPAAEKPKGPKGPAQTPSPKGNLGRRALRAKARSARKLRLVADKEYAKAYFGARSKRATEKKAAFRKKKKGKK